ncbi:MAG: hypothetical protein GQE15_34270 [Archangiaceae bacterium]|nr:hypothetical protein [Archangiaceae bacterium]
MMGVPPPVAVPPPAEPPAVEPPPAVPPAAVPPPAVPPPAVPPPAVPPAAVPPPAVPPPAVPPPAVPPPAVPPPAVPPPAVPPPAVPPPAVPPPAVPPAATPEPTCKRTSWVRVVVELTSQSAVMTTRPTHFGSLAVTHVNGADAFPAESSITDTAGANEPTVDDSRTVPFAGTSARFNAMTSMMELAPRPSMARGEAVSSSEGSSGC